jgi:hypothetical protein
MPEKEHPLSPFIVEPMKTYEARVRAVMFTLPEMEHPGG